MGKRKKKKIKKTIGEIKNVTTTIPGWFDNKGWKEFKQKNK